MPDKIAVSMPGKTGDAIYVLPTIRYLCERLSCTADFYTSTHVERARDLFEYQSCIDQMIVPHGYKIERYDMGIQPWQMPINLGEYKITYHLGYRHVPDCRLDHFMAKQIGITPNLLPPVYYEFPDLRERFKNLPKEFYLIASNGETSYKGLFIDVINKSPIPMIQVGLMEHILYEVDVDKYYNWGGLSFLETCYLLSKSSGFVGLQTNQLVLANGFKIPRVAVHDGIHWDMRHVIHDEYSHYPINPTAEQILELLNG